MLFDVIYLCDVLSAAKTAPANAQEQELLAEAEALLKQAAGAQAPLAPAPAPAVGVPSAERRRQQLQDELIEALRSQVRSHRASFLRARLSFSSPFSQTSASSTRSTLPSTSRICGGTRSGCMCAPPSSTAPSSSSTASTATCMKLL